MHHSTRPATGVPEMGKEGGWDLPPRGEGGGGGGLSPRPKAGGHLPVCLYIKYVIEYLSDFASRIEV